MEVYAPDDQQPALIRSADAFSAGEMELCNFFNDSANVEKLIYFLSLEDRKGKDKFDATRFSLFKGNSFTTINHHQGKKKSRKFWVL